MADTRVRINLASGEIEIQGSEEFVERQLSNLESLISTLSYNNRLQTQSPSSPEGKVDKETTTTTTEPQLPDTFGEWLNQFPDDINDSEKALIAAYYIQMKSADNEFKTFEVNKILKEQGVKLANTSNSIKRLVSRKLAFTTRKEGKISYYRLSKNGREHLASLLER